MHTAVELYLLILLVFMSVINIRPVDGRFAGPRVKRQTDTISQPKRVICQYAYWAAKRPGEFKFTPKDIEPNLCTHIVYNYARLEPSQGIVSYDPKEDIVNKRWDSIVELRSINPQAKILLSVGGLFEGSSRFTKMASDTKQRSIFVQSAINLMKDYKFDGLDITWLFPGFSQGSSNADKSNYVSLVKELREVFKDEFLLTISVPALKQHIESGFNVPELVKYVDYISVLAYSYHDSPDATVNHHGPLYSLPDDPDNRDANVDFTIREYIKRGADPSQLNLVIPMYGVAFQLDDPEKTDIGSKTEDEGEGLEESGALIYFELCQRIIKESWTVKKVNTTAMGPYAFKDKLWVAFDDEEMVRNKAKYALQKGLGGLSFWTVDQDDFKGVCHQTRFPLLKAGREIFLASHNISKSSSDTKAASDTLLKNKAFQKGLDVELVSNSSSLLPDTHLSSTSSLKRQNSPNNMVEQMSLQDLLTKLDRLVDDNKIVYRSNRDLIFANVKVSYNNHYNFRIQDKNFLST